MQEKCFSNIPVWRWVKTLATIYCLHVDFLWHWWYWTLKLRYQSHSLSYSTLTITFSAYLKLRFPSWFHVEISSWNSEQLCETWDICANSECCAPWLIMIPPTHNHLTFINDWNCLMWFKSRGGYYSIPGEKPPQPATQDLSQFLLCTSILNFTRLDSASTEKSVQNNHLC